MASALAIAPPRVRCYVGRAEGGSGLSAKDGLRGDDAVLAEHGGRVLVSFESGSELWRAGQAFVVMMHGWFGPSDLAESIDRIYREANPPDAVVFVESRGLSGYDPAILGFYRQDQPRTMPRIMGVVLRGQLSRMVARTAAIGFNAFTRRRLEIFDELAPALAAVRPVKRAS